jgi:hypothetical protein
MEGIMTYTQQTLSTHPTARHNVGLLTTAIDALNDCAQACTGDADDDLSEPDVAEMVKCIRLCLDCADVCAATARVISRQTAYDANVTNPLVEACIVICKACADECDGHAQMHAHCRVCAEACRRCETVCREFLNAID